MRHAIAGMPCTAGLLAAIPAQAERTGRQRPRSAPCCRSDCRWPGGDAVSELAGRSYLIADATGEVVSDVDLIKQHAFVYLVYARPTRTRGLRNNDYQRAA